MLEEQGDKPEAIAARIARVREIMRLNKREFAATIGMSEQSYGQYENGTRPFSFSTCLKIRKRHNISLEFIYFGNIDDLPHKIAVEL